MYGRFLTTMSVVVTLAVVIIGNIPARAADAAEFDPNKKFSVIAGSAVLGDPAVYTNLGNGRTGGTVVTTSLNTQSGLTIVASLVEPGQNGEAGSGHGILLAPQETGNLIQLLRKGPSWVKIAQENGVADYSKTVGYVRGAKGNEETVAVVFVVSADQTTALQLEHQIGGKTKRYKFAINSALKFSSQLLHYLASAGSEFAPENPTGDAETDKLFN